MIKSDSRRVKKGDIFVALPGISSDGDNYINDAIKNGCSLVVATSGDYSVKTRIVSDTKKYLQKYLLTNYSFLFDNMLIIGVTGTNGKTTIAHLIYESLNKLGVKCSMIGTLGYYRNKKILNLSNTCPDLALMYELLIDSYDNGFRCVLIEASSQGLIEDRLYGISFDYAIFTNLTHDHLDYHKSMENYALAKQKLFKQLKPNGVGIVNIDDSFCHYFFTDNQVTYGFNSSDYQILNYNDFRFTFKHVKKYDVNHNLIGKYNVYNLMAAIIVLDNMKFSFDKILDVLGSIKSPNGRMEIYNLFSNRIIVDYAHTPDALKQVLSSISNYNKLYAVFGCTGNRDKMKRPIMTKLLLQNCDYVIITSDDLYDEDFNSIVSDMIDGVTQTNYDICIDRKKAIDKGISMLLENDILLVLGKGHEGYMKIGRKLIPFNDGKCINNILNKYV